MKKIIATIATIGMVSLSSLSSSAQDNNIIVDGSTTVGPLVKSFAEYYMKNHPEVNITVGESGSGNGAKSLLNGTCHVATMSRAMKGEELEAAKSKGIQVVEHIVALDGLAMIVHPSNPVKGLTKQQVKEIYMGEITSWKEVGGPNLKIVVIGRDTNSGTYESFQNLVMKADNVTEKAEICGSNGQIRQRIISTQGAIGYVGLGFLDSVKALEVDGLAPTQDTVRNKKYPISRPLFVYTNGEPKPGTPLNDYIMLSSTEEGRKIIEEQGFVPVQ